jgi:hypothetical protein
MSVLIKGMKMPENCLECKIKAWEERYNVYVCPFGGILELSCLANGRRDECPLVELPEKHGRLVEFIDVATETNDDTGLEEINLGEALSAYLKMREAPIVIEAEG